MLYNIEKKAPLVAEPSKRLIPLDPGCRYERQRRRKSRKQRLRHLQEADPSKKGRGSGGGNGVYNGGEACCRACVHSVSSTCAKVCILC
jgi:hypothetical protein